MTKPIPPLPADTNSALRTYLRAFAFLLPSMLAWIFAAAFLLPRVDKLWQEAGFANSKAQWLMSSSVALTHYAPKVFACVVIVLALAEARWSKWSRYRRRVVAAATLLFHTAVLTGITAIAVTACLAAPALAARKAK